MARSDKVPFRREFQITENGRVGSEEGFFVGDILSLHLDTSKDVSILVEGRVGKNNAWETVLKDSDKNHFPNIDIRSYEYIKISLFKIPSNGVRLTLFGYEQNIPLENILVQQVDRDFDISRENSHNLKHILDELKIMNKHLKAITGEDYE